MHPTNGRSGFSMVVLAILLAVASMLIVLALPNDTEKLAINVKRTSAKLTTITNALSIYYETNSVAPCPAKFTVVQGNSAFGAANCTCGAGIICPSTSGMGNVLIGSVPVKTLGLSDDFALDEWGNRITYAMDNSTVPVALTVKDLNGKLDINNKGNQPIAFFFSHGPNGKGAYLTSGVLNGAAPCTGAAAGEDATRSELENCDSTAAGTADRNFIRSSWSAGTSKFFDDLTGELYKKSWVGLKDDGYQWLLFQMDKGGTIGSLESATTTSSNNVWKNAFPGLTPAMGAISCNLADNGKTVCVTVGGQYVNALFGGCGALPSGGCATYWAFSALPESGFVNKSNVSGFNATGDFDYFGTSLSGSKPNVKCWKVASTRFLCMAVSTNYYKVFSIDSETGMNEISAAAPTVNGAFNGYNFWGNSFSGFDVAGFDCAATGNTAGDFICMAAGQGGSFLSFKLNEATGISNKTATECYIGSLTGTVLGCSDSAGLGGQARDVSCNMVSGSTSQAACVAVYNRSFSGRAARLFIATTSTTPPITFCPLIPTLTTSTCLVQPALIGGDILKAQDGLTAFTSANMGDVLNFNCRGTANSTTAFNCFIGGLGTGSSTAGYMGLYNFTTSGFTTTAVQSLQPFGGVYAPSCTALDEKKYYCLYSGTGAGSGCGSGNNCNYSVWNNYQTKLNSGTYAAWPVDTAWSFFSIAK